MFMVIRSGAESGLSNYTSIAWSFPRMPKQRLHWLYGTRFLSPCTHLLAVTPLPFSSLQQSNPTGSNPASRELLTRQNAVVNVKTGYCENPPPSCKLCISISRPLIRIAGIKHTQNILPFLLKRVCCTCTLKLSEAPDTLKTDWPR